MKRGRSEWIHRWYATGSDPILRSVPSLATVRLHAEVVEAKLPAVRRLLAKRDRISRSRWVPCHPAKDIALVVEVSDTSLDDDQRLKLPQYARARLPVYWIINLTDRRVEVYTHPRGGKNPGYRHQTNYAPGQAVPVVVGGAEVGSLEVKDLLP